MGKYIKKPVEVEAFKWTGGHDQTEGPDWIVKALEDNWAYFINEDTEDVKLIIVTLEGLMSAERGDYIIKGVQNELYPCKPDIFEQTYAKAGEPQLLYTRWVPDEVVKIYDEAGLVEELKGVSKEHLRKYYAYAVSAYELNVDYEDTDDRPDVNIKTLWEKANQNNKI